MTTTDERQSLLSKNLAAWSGVPRQDLASPLDSSLKKNTAFIKKARLGLNQENLPSLLADIRTLSLEKYLSEVVSAIAEGISKVRAAQDIAAATEVVSSLHQRFVSPFTTVLAYYLVRSLAPPPSSYLASLTPEQREKDESTRVSRQRSLIKIVTELWLLGVFRTIQDAVDGAGTEAKKKKLDEDLPVFCLRELLVNDKDFTNLSIATSFVKAFASLLDPPTNNTEAFEKIRNMLLNYHKELVRHLQKQHDNLNREKSRFEDTTIAHGAAPSSREAVIAELQRTHDKQIAAAQILVDVLKLDALVFDDTFDSIMDDPGMIRGVGGLRHEGDARHDDSLWDDEEQRRFYEVLLDLSQVVPSDMLCEEKAPDTGSVSVSDPLKVDEADGEYDEEDLSEAEMVEEELETPTTTIGVKVHNLLIRLPEMTSRDSIDNCAIEFAFLNSKASRNRLVKALLDLSMVRTDLLPYYARLIAILNQHLTSIADSVVAHLHRECRRYTAGKGLRKDVPRRIFNIRYISELVKFGIVPIHVTFHCLKIILESFTKYDIEVLASMLEHCGRFLLKSEATTNRMENVLAIVMRKSQNVSGMERTLIENAFYYVNPPEHAGIPQIERDPLEMYVEKLVYSDLSNKSQDHILKRLKRLDWNNSLTVQFLAQIFSHPWKLNYSCISLLAALLSGLAKAHPDFSVKIIDETIEDIRLGLEENIFRENQRRIATMKYLGELFNCRLVESKLVLDTLYLCELSGCPDARPVIGGTISDPAYDFFRVRLILTLLESCASTFNNGSLRSKMDLFLCSFQYYIKTKSDLPRDVEYEVVKILNLLRPGLRLCSTVDEALSELEEASSHFDIARQEQAPDHDDSGSSDSATQMPDIGALSSTGEETPESEFHPDADDEQEFVLLEKKREQDDLDKFAEEDLDREFSKLMNESLEVRKQEVRRPLEITLPRKHISFSETNALDPVIEMHSVQRESTKQAVKFTFLSRKSKPRSLELPSDSPLAINNAAYRMAEEREKQTIRDLTLKYEVAQCREELDEGLAKAGVGVKYLPAMLAGQKGGTRSGSMFKMGARDPKALK